MFVGLTYTETQTGCLSGNSKCNSLRKKFCPQQDNKTTSALFDNTGWSRPSQTCGTDAFELALLSRIVLILSEQGGQTWWQSVKLF